MSTTVTTDACVATKHGQAPWKNWPVVIKQQPAFNKIGYLIKIFFGRVIP